MEKHSNVTTVKSLQHFVHGPYTGKTGEMMEMPTLIANELAAAGLVSTIVETSGKKTPQDDAADVSGAGTPDDAENAPDDAPVVPLPAIRAAAVINSKMVKPLSNK